MSRRLPPLSRGSMALVLNALLGLLALGLAFAPPGEGAPKLQLASAAGALSLSNSKEGSAIFRAAAMRPGEEASGSVTITNTGTVTGALTLTPAAPTDTPGTGGGMLSSRLELLVIEVTTVTAPVTVYAGTLEQMDPTDVGALSPGMLFGWFNDALVKITYVLVTPTVIVVGTLLRPTAPVASRVPR